MSSARITALRPGGRVTIDGGPFDVERGLPRITVGGETARVVFGSRSRLNQGGRSVPWRRTRSGGRFHGTPDVGLTCGSQASMLTTCRRRCRSATSPTRCTASLDLHRHSHTDLLGRAWTLRDNIGAYEAMYISLAEALGAP
jgi:hypothetical protein